MRRYANAKGISPHDRIFDRKVPGDEFNKSALHPQPMMPAPPKPTRVSPQLPGPPPPAVAGASSAAKANAAASTVPPKPTRRPPLPPTAAAAPAPQPRFDAGSLEGLLLRELAPEPFTLLDYGPPLEWYSRSGWRVLPQPPDDIDVPAPTHFNVHFYDQGKQEARAAGAAVGAAAATAQGTKAAGAAECARAAGAAAGVADLPASAQAARAWPLRQSESVNAMQQGCWPCLIFFSR